MTGTEVEDKTYAADWAAELLHGDGAANLPAAVLDALPERVLRKLAANVELARRVALAERERDEAAAENGQLHQRVFLQHQRIMQLLATGRDDPELGRIGSILAAAPCVCLARPATPEPECLDEGMRPEPKRPRRILRLRGPVRRVQ